MHPVKADDIWCALRRLGMDRQWKTGRLDRASQLESQCWLMRSLREVGKLRRRSHDMVIGMYGSSPKVKRGGPITHIVGKACAMFF